MQNESTCRKVTQSISSLCASHRTHLANEYAFLISQELINKVKNNKFMRPPRRAEEELDCKLEFEANTSASSGESVDSFSDEDLLKHDNAANFTPRSGLSKKLMDAFLTFEDYLTCLSGSAAQNIEEARRFNRLVLSHVLAHEEACKTVPTQKLALAALVLVAEQIKLEREFFLNFVRGTLGLKRIDSVAQIKGTRAYLLLSRSL